MQDLGALGGIGSEGNAINDAGQVVGDVTMTNGILHAFIYSGGTMQDLNSLLANPIPGFVLSSGQSINDAGQITGMGKLNGDQHAFLLTPTPEPGACAIALIAAAGLLRRRRGSRKVAP